ncbi:ABC transporter permease [Arthrobacter sp. B3I4]|uniref:ABC transporter permease n=1 Tax=Arthrobacter sp. B3I4 TaxID=3042267 RepID=UPI00277F2FA0|nr:ABC transporter permease subunit [Arthrobacter sp. B3I4]MDQ0757362.1 ABC-type spermidine/putrescine transport system permease subunit I [Arthrobacter sp. B3I4]
MALPPILFILTFVGFPIVLALAFSLGFTGGLNSVVATIGLNVHEAENWWGTLAAYQDVFTNPMFLADLGVTLLVTVVSASTVLFMAMGIGLYLRLRGGWLASLLSGLAVVPLFIPVVIASWAILTFYSGNGFVRSFFAQFGVEAPAWGYTVVAVIIASIWTSLPFAVLMIASGLQAIPDAMIESARDAGAGFLRIVTSIMVPMAFVPIVIAGTFTAISVIGSFTVPYFTGPNTPNMLGVELTKYFISFNQPQQSMVMAFAVFIAASGIAGFYVWANLRSAKDQGRV